MSPEPDPGHTSPAPPWQSWPWPGRPGRAPAPPGVSGLAMSVLSGPTGVGGALVMVSAAGPLQGLPARVVKGWGGEAGGCCAFGGLGCGPLGSGDGDREEVWLVRLSWGTLWPASTAHGFPGGRARLASPALGRSALPLPLGCSGTHGRRPEGASQEVCSRGESPHSAAVSASSGDSHSTRPGLPVDLAGPLARAAAVLVTRDV